VDGAFGLLGGIAQLLDGVIDSPLCDSLRFVGRSPTRSQSVGPGSLMIGAARLRHRTGGDRRGARRCGANRDLRARIARRACDRALRALGRRWSITGREVHG
jgi:hypothetical protein